MTISVRQLTGAVVVSFCVGAFMTPVWTQAPGGAQARQGRRYQAANLHDGGVHEGARGEDGRVAQVGTGWKPMHELRVKDGSMVSWAAIGQAVPGDESNGPVYATVTTYRGWPDPTKMNFEALAQKAHPQGDVNA